MRLIAPTLALLALTSVAVPGFADVLTLQGGKGQLVPGTGVTLLLSGVTDQRCPGEVDCFWEGMIRAEITVSTAMTVEEVVLCNLCVGASDLATAGGLALGLVSLAPSTGDLAALGRAPELRDYGLTVTYAAAD